MVETRTSSPRKRRDTLREPATPPVRKKTKKKSPAPAEESPADDERREDTTDKVAAAEADMESLKKGAVAQRALIKEEKSYVQLEKKQGKRVSSKIWSLGLIMLPEVTSQGKKVLADNGK